MDRNEFIQKTIQLAVENVNSGRGGPFGAMVVKDGQIIATGTNQVTSILDPTAHAEVVAIRQACQALGSFELTGCEIYCSCEPCAQCAWERFTGRGRRKFFMLLPPPLRRTPALTILSSSSRYPCPMPSRSCLLHS